METDVVNILTAVVVVAGLAAALGEIWWRDAAIFREILGDTEAFARAGRDRGPGQPGLRFRDAPGAARSPDDGAERAAGRLVGDAAPDGRDASEYANWLTRKPLPSARMGSGSRGDRAARRAEAADMQARILASFHAPGRWHRGRGGGHGA